MSPLPQLPTWARALVGVLLSVLAVGVTVTIVDDPAPAPAPHKKTITVKLGGPGDKTIPAPAPAAEVQAAVGVADHADARDESPPGLSAKQLDVRDRGLDRLAAHDQLPITAPDAAPSFPGCTSRFVRNYSTRRGVAPRELVAHYTVSRNVPGWSDVWAIVSLFDRAAFAASSTFVIDAEGNCAYIVRVTDKPWTQAAANPFSISIEFIAMGDEGHLSTAALRKGGQVFARAAKQFGIPIRLGAVRNCLPAVPGIVDHSMLGACGGGHHDLKPFGGATASDAARMGPLIAATRAAAAAAAAAKVPHPTAQDRQDCRELPVFRARRPRTAHDRAIIARRVKRVHAHGFYCAAGRVHHQK